MRPSCQATIGQLQFRQDLTLHEERTVGSQASLRFSRTGKAWREKGHGKQLENNGSRYEDAHKESGPNDYNKARRTCGA